MKSALIVCTNGSDDVEFITPVNILTRAGLKVTTCAVNTQEERLVKLARGSVTLANTTIEDVTDTYDILVIPGGPGAKTLLDSDKFKKLLLDQKESGRKIAAICAAPGVVLYKAGILTDADKKSCFPGCECGGSFSSNGVEVTENGQIVTGRGPNYAMEWSLNILKNFIDENTYKTVAEQVLFSE